MPYWRAYYHLIWATYERRPLILPEFEDDLHRVIAAQCQSQGGHCFIVNGIADHVHVITTIPPALSVAQMVKNLKGTSSRFVTAECSSIFKWQKGYGVFTISQKNVEAAIGYVRNQKEHHAIGTIIPVYERVSDGNLGPRLAGDANQ